MEGHITSWTKTDKGFEWRYFKPNCIEVRKSNETKPHLFVTVDSVISQWIDIYEAHEGDIEHLEVQG